MIQEKLNKDDIYVLATDNGHSSGDDEKSIWENNKTFLVVVVVYFFSLVAFIGVRVLFGLGWLDFMSDLVADVVFSFVVQIGLMLVLPILAIKIFSKRTVGSTARDFGFNRPGRRVIGYAFLMGALFYLFNLIIAGFFFSILDMINFRLPGGGGIEHPGIAGLLISLFIIGVLPGLCEEVTYRGMVMQSFIRKLGLSRALFFSSLLFGLMHLNIMQFFYAAILGYFIALAVLATRSIWTGVIIHFMNNAIGVFFQYSAEFGWHVDKVMNLIYAPFALPFGIVLMMIYVFFLYWMIQFLIHKFAKENYNKQEKAYIARFLHQNPEYLKGRVERGESVAIDDIAEMVRTRVKHLNRSQQTRFYLEPHCVPQRLSPAESTFFWGIVILGSVVTVMTLVWGLF
jgi:membrane protease YdiL (CAAX protease family)